MLFEYQMYFRQNCIGPLGFLVFTVALIVCVILNIFKMQKPIDIKKLVFEIITLCIFVNLFIINLAPLIRGGIYLLFEREADKTIVSGVIEETGEIDFYTGAKYGVEQNRGSGETITVNGVKYNLVTYGDLKEGDSVTAEVLPKSRFVLSIMKNEK